MPKVDLTKPLSDAEYDRLIGILDECSDLNLDNLIGLVSAVLVSPGRVQPTQWVPLTLRNPQLPNTQATVDLILRLYTEVATCLDDDEPFMPELDDEEAVRDFSSGFVLGAKLDATWAADEQRWAMVKTLAYFAGEHDLVGADQLALLDASPEARIIARMEIETNILQAHLESRKSAQPARRPDSRVGRNDPCPCGSGKKYKRCCMITAVSH